MRIWLIALLATLLAAPAAADDRGDVWFRILGPSGQLIGWQHEVFTASATGFEAVRERDLAYRIDGHAPTRQNIRVIRAWDKDRRFKRLAIETSSNGSPPRLREIFGPGATSRSAPPADAEMGDSESLIELEKRLHRSAAGTPFYEYDPPSRTYLKIEWRDGASTAKQSSKPITLIAWRGDQLGIAWTISLNDEGKIVRAEQPLPGSAMVFERADGPVIMGNMQSVPHQMLRSPFVIGHAALRGHIRYQIGLPAILRNVLPNTGEQTWRAESGTMQLDICTSCGPGLSTDPNELATWRKPTKWLQSDAPALQSAVRRIAVMKAPERSRMKLLGKMARERLSGIDYDGHYSALQAWKRRAGDCTEDAALYAALARAAGFPARVASGLVYTRERYHGAQNAFLPHSWVLAYVDGKWESFDISISSFDTTHIALTIGDGEPGPIASATQMSGLIELQSMTEVRTRPAS